MTILKPWPEHQNPTNQRRIASAPYNFVPLPEKIIPAVHNADELPDHDKYYQGRHSGYFDVTLTTRSPLYIRGSLSAKDLSRQEELKNKPEFFHTGNEHEPVIPGSSLRGMLRALLEIVSYSKIQWVSKKRLFFRTMDDSAVGLYYNRRMVEKLDVVHLEHQFAPVYRARVEGGFFRVDENGTYSIEPCTVARVETEDLQRLFNLAYSRDVYELDGRDLDERTARNPNQTPKWLYQHQQVWANIDKIENDYFFREQRTRDGNIRHPDLYLRFQRARNLAKSSGQGKQWGKLVLTGPMNNKHLAFLFVPLKETAPRIEVPNDPRQLDPNKRLVNRFHDDDQLTQWQKKAFPAGIPPNGQLRWENGHLRDGDPVFFLRDENGDLVFFGRAQMFRLPYKQRPIDLVPCELRRVTDIDYAEALFGFTLTHEQVEELKANLPQGDKRRAYASRVIVTDGVLQLQPNQENIWLAGSFEEVTRPRILATPKPTAFQHYLTQQHPNDNKALNHYDSTPPESDKTVIRGHKLYWHQGLVTDQDHTLKQIHDAIKETAYIGPKDTQHTRFKPLRPGVQFSFRVYFENLSDPELGALCWTLHPHGEQGRRYCHHLGMGKPLGMGAVELQARLHIIKRPSRYEKLFNDSHDNWQLGEASTVEDLADSKVLDRLTQPFEKHLLHELNPDLPCTRLADMLRIAMLLKLLEWPGYQAEGGGELYLVDQQRPNTRYMELKEYRNRPVLPDSMQFDDLYFEGKFRPQVPQADQLRVNQVGQLPILEQPSMPEAHLQAAIVQQAPVEKNRQQPVLSPELAEQFYIGRELSNLVNFTQDEQGVEVRFWNWDSTQVIGFIPKELIDRELGRKISVVVTGLRQESSGRLVVELKLRSRR